MVPSSDRALNVHRREVGTQPPLKTELWVGPDRACKMQAQDLHCGLRLFAGLGAYLVKSGLGSAFTK
jgi:hypothetical protein